MKVTTEGCLFGAWVAAACKAPRTVLDIGTGTGLLALMLAQIFPAALIDAVEVDGPAAGEARENFGTSPWSERLRMTHGTVQSFDPPTTFDLIISNPPFYNQSLRSASRSINRARHDGELSQEDLLDAICRLLADDGEVFVLYPVPEAERFEGLAQGRGLSPQRKLKVYDVAGAAPIRVIGQYAKTVTDTVEEDFYIKTGDGNYTPGFVKLLRDYYLHL
ncbi:tRNA1(Val) (adenine(37)-N6)-methyltransferase [Marinoscillum sp.]|uniref:tRNA1(Val) (adenine(37)-N6)-methyltransferase n=1 Tax=Marinoscillum sp. TaxID=2024838 RepID=UPI003BA95101